MRDSGERSLASVVASWRTLAQRQCHREGSPTPRWTTASRDFAIGRRTAENWNALLTVGEAANQRLCDAQATDARPAPDVLTFVEARPSAIDGMASTLPSCGSGILA